MSDQDQGVEGGPAMGGGGDDVGEIKVKRGKNVAFGLLAIVIIAGAAGAGVWYGFFREDPAAAHEAFRREVFGVAHAQYYQAFWSCALAAPEDNFRNNTELTSKILQNANGADAARYAEHLRKSESCLPLLAKGIPEYRALKTNAKTPPDYAADLDTLATNLEAIQKSWSDFADFTAGIEKRARLSERIKLRGEAYAGYEGAVEQNDAERRTKFQANAVSYYEYLSCVLGDTSYTSYEGDPESDDAAHYKLVAHLDEQCRTGGDAYVEKLQTTCADKLFPAAPPAPTPEFEAAVAHWVKQGGDYGSAVPLMECLQEYEERRSKSLVDDIAKAWYDYRGTYRRIYELSKSKTGTIFDRGRDTGGGGEGAAE